MGSARRPLQPTIAALLVVVAIGLAATVCAIDDPSDADGVHPLALLYGAVIGLGVVAALVAALLLVWSGRRSRRR